MGNSKLERNENADCATRKITTKVEIEIDCWDLFTHVKTELKITRLVEFSVLH